MGFRVVRFMLGVVVVIALIQIWTTLHFSSVHDDEAIDNVRQRGKAKRISSLLSEPRKELTATAEWGEIHDPKTQAVDFVRNILSNLENINCQVQHKDAKSALSRAKSAQCKNIIQKTACLLEADKLYLKNIQRLCPMPKEIGGIPKNVDEGKPYGPPIRVVFMLTVHGRAFRQIKRLLKTIYHSNHYYYIHVDSRSDYLYRQLVELSSTLPNVEVTLWRMATIWGGSSLLQMLLKALEDLTKKNDWKWDFFINLSESDYPIKSNTHLSNFLRAHRDDNFLKSHGRDTPRFIHKQGLDRTFVECDEHMWRIGDRKLPNEIDIDGGSDWIGLNRKFADYVINSDDQLVTRLKRLYAFALLPAESFFHTVLKNGPQCQAFIRTNLRVTNWKRKLGCRCQYKHVVDWCGCSPNDFKPEDLPRLQKSKHDLFARKFEAIVNQKIINLVDEMLFGSSPLETPGIHSYWENFYHHIDDDHRLNDALRTYFASFNRMSSRYIGSHYCANLPIGQTKEVNYLNQEDDFSGLLILQNIGLSKRGKQASCETWLTRVDPEEMMNLNMSEGPSRLTGLQVGTGWDQKERILRNYARLMGPWDDPVLVHYWKKGKPFNVKLLWIDPISVVTGVYEMRVQNDWVVSFHKPTYHKPLRPGKWTIKMVYREGDADLVIGQTTFLIIPLAFNKGVAVTAEQALSLNSGPPSGRYTSQFTIEFDREAKNIDELARNATLNSKKTGQELNNWIDGLVKLAWGVEDSCVVGDKLGECPGYLRCAVTSWSSRSPDPKSEIGKISVNGTLR